ncbi:mannose-6-phosphate isomerase, class I [Micromonospora phytophila]|uniref:mannose-6-phosphate isomerase, class I n=1 Tax=Micromonospora phytophila TaxID=709888 RepID=UPI00202F90D9|nr:mannose-6-phosphate isomerase, class I [Micromonospora phytophila]MCM0676917.1 mannose-6-phosphate isomerase, class I [Micromonospora phytophila]
MELLYGPIRDYAWGSRSAIAELQGRPVPSDGPEAELWLGAHPGGPATVDRDGDRVSLTELLLAEPEHWLGERVLGRFGTRLPFLLKVLAADAPLSLQAHPDAEQARAGHAADAVRPDGHRNYVDPYHKPELLVALSPMEALCGFRDPAVSAEVLAAFGVPALAPVLAALRTGPAGLRDAVRLLLSWPAAERDGLVAAVASALVDGADAELVRQLAAAYPGDPGVLVALLLNRVRLAPGEAIWMPAGNLHAYLRGTGVEIMAASDNVLRGGLTPKRVDVEELLRVLRFEVLIDPVVPALEVAPGVATWPVPVEDFALHRVTVGGGLPEVTLSVPGPRVVLCRGGELSVDDGTGAVALAPGQAAVGTAAAGPLCVSGAGEAYVASCGLR